MIRHKPKLESLAIFPNHQKEGRGRSLIVATVLAAFLCLTPAQQSFALTSDEMFADGNRLSRDDLYWAALLRYQQAYEAGMNSAVLHYNIGVTNYRAEQHTRARAALLLALQSPSLRVATQFNLGLNAYAAGDTDAALEWFYQARDQEQNREIRKLAREAISRLEGARIEAVEEEVPAEKLAAERKYTEFDISTFVGYGSNDNIYRAPSEPYINFADPAFPVITPEVVSGAFVPVDLRLKYSINSYEHESFYAAYRLQGKLYTEKEIENADEYSHELSFGSSYFRQEDNRTRRVFSAFTIAQHENTYFDPDNGSERLVNNVPIGNRMSYARFGPEFAWVQAFERFALGLRMKGQLWNYEDPKEVPEYDHEYFVFGAHAQYSFTETSLLRLTVDKYSRRFSDRPSFDLDGNQFITNPTARYDYLAIGLNARQRITRNMWFGFRIERTDREDRYLGYYDYTRDEFGFDFSWAPTPRVKLELASFYRHYDYPNAFAFHNPIAGIRSLETIRSNLFVEFRMSPHFSINAKTEYRESASSDSRIDYDQMWFQLGVTWRK
jgi:hypothetical protein